MAGKGEKEDKIDDKKEDEIVVVDESEEEEKKADDGELDSSKDDEKEKVVQKKRPARQRGNDNQKRINELWMKRKEAEENAAENARVAVAERAKNSEYEKITAAALEDSLNTKRELLKERLQRAQEAEDPKKTAEITVELGKIEAQAAQMERYKIENQINAKPANGQQQPQKREEAPSSDEIYERMSPAGKKWMDENSDWYESSGENHDPEKSGDVTYYAQTLEKELLRSGRAAEIGTRAYFKKIDDYIKQNWNEERAADEETDEEEEEVQAPSKKVYAAPVGNRGNGAKPPGARREIKITQQERDMATSLNIKDNRGVELSDAEKIKRFVALRENVPSAGPISIKTIKR